MKKQVKKIELKPNKSIFVEAAFYLHEIDELKQRVREQKGLIYSLRRSNKKLRNDLFQTIVEPWKIQYR